MKRIRIGAYLASALSAAYLLRTALWAAIGPTVARFRAPAKTGPAMIALALVIVLAVGGFVLYLMFSGPRMRVQPKLLPYEALFPAVPQGMVPVFPVGTQKGTPNATGRVWEPNLPVVRNPLDDTERTRRIGQAYYRNYCVFCHGKGGRGDGPVGQSYVPVPTDLTAPAVQKLSDSNLYRGMLTGVGHEPVLGYVVDPNAPWYLVSYVRTLSRE